MRRTKQNMHKLNEEMGIEIPVAQRTSYRNRYRDRPHINYYNGNSNRSSNNYGYGYGNHNRGSVYRRSSY
ncbi:MAG: hypothetical protein AB7F53_08630, partial [Nitrososphaeraceae archaeon]